MDENQRGEQHWPPVAIDSFQQLKPALGHVRVMYRFLHEVVATDPDLKPHYNRLLLSYAAILQQELAPYAFDMADVLVALEDAYARRTPPVT
ncbi:MAG: hypothetical protein ACTHQM_24745 [Thermoanaerobaculia bacterium]